MYSEHQCTIYNGIQNEPDVIGNACCTKACKRCGGPNCDQRPGGQSNCCVGQIIQQCGSGQQAPCLLTRGTHVLPRYNCKKGADLLVIEKF